MNKGMDLNTILPEKISERYNLKKRIGKGGMGDVYLAEDMQLMREVAIKTIRPELLHNEDVKKRIERECKMHAAVRIHPHIVGLYDKIASDDTIYLIMEYVEGETLTDYIASAKKEKQEISTGMIINIILQVLDALSCIHSHNIIHRDIKPSNIILGNLKSDQPNAKLMDFGIAREVLEDDDVTKLTMLDSGGPGTPAYMSPERIDSKTYGDICPATDLYSVGIILYELFRLEPPFSGTMTEVFSGHLAREPDFSKLNSLQEALRAVLSKALEKKTTIRYQDAQHFSIDLKATGLVCSDETLPSTFFDPSTLNQTILDTKYSNPLPSQKREKRIRFAWCAGILLCVVALISSYIFTKDKIDTAPNMGKEEVTPPTVESSAPPMKPPIASLTKENTTATIKSNPQVKVPSQEGEKQQIVETPPKTPPNYDTYPHPNIPVVEEITAEEAFIQQRSKIQNEYNRQQMKQIEKNKKVQSQTQLTRSAPRVRKRSDDIMVIPTR